MMYQRCRQLFLIDQYGMVKYIHSGYSEEKMNKLEFAIRGLLDKK